MCAQSISLKRTNLTLKNDLKTVPFCDFGSVFCLFVAMSFLTPFAQNRSKNSDFLVFVLFCILLQGSQEVQKQLKITLKTGSKIGPFLIKKEALFCHQDVFSDHNQFLRFCETLKMSVFQKHGNRPLVLISLFKTAKSPQKVVVRCTEKRVLFGNKAYMSMSKPKTRFDTNFFKLTCEESPCK